MVLVDTSVWIDHIRSNDPCVFKLLEKNEVLYLHLSRARSRWEASPAVK